MINKDIVKKFTIHTFPTMNCPICKVSSIVLSKKSINRYETRESNEAHSHEAWEPDWITETFHGALTCTNPNCKGIVIVVGDVEVNWDSEVDPSVLKSEPYYNYYSFKYFYPPINLFVIPDAAPEDVKDIITLSFGMFFYSPSSAANQARIALEKILNSQKIRAYSTINGKRKRLSLNERINDLPGKYEYEKILFLAVKWLGNAGSHDNNISHSDVFDLYEIFEKLLNEIYCADKKKILKLAKTINKRRGPMGKS